ncbi:MAG: Na/Pi cotransporter family protein [Clostridia bacterium]|nr:Na/Pi cotransporter family protein [Clostridia bacterium]
MDVVSNMLSLLGGLSLFLYGMHLMGEGLEKRAGNRLKGILARLTSNRFRALLLGGAVTALIQSSSAVTVMAVGFVNSGLMTLSQVIGIIMGANIGTTVTAWLTGLTQLEGEGVALQLFKPSTFAPILAVVGVSFCLFSKRESRRTTGTILLGFSVLIFGMDAMSAAAKPLAANPSFGEVLLWFQNPLLGVLAGAVVTAILQSSSASVGILQALSGAGQLTVGAAVPIVMGQNIGTCVTTLLSAVGATRNAKRTAILHLYFNLIGTAILLTAFWLVRSFLFVSVMEQPISAFGIALVHTLFNVLCTAILFPFSSLLERLAVRTVAGESAEREAQSVLDERLLAAPALAVARSRAVAEEMARLSVENVREAFGLLRDFSPSRMERLEEGERRVDRMEDEIGSYLIALGSRTVAEQDSLEITALLHWIGDFERISDHALNVAEAAGELAAKGSGLSEEATKDLGVILAALEEILTLSLRAFCEGEREAAWRVEPLEHVIDGLEREIRAAGIERLRNNRCNIDASFLFSDLLGDLERIGDHCSNVASVCLGLSTGDLRAHEFLQHRRISADSDFEGFYKDYRVKYSRA